jgi:hypothetical protein
MDHKHSQYDFKESFIEPDEEQQFSALQFSSIMLNINKSQQYCKVLSSDWVHNGFKYKFGLNILNEKFNDDPKQSCCSGRLYITQLRYIRNYLHYGTQIALIELPVYYPQFKLIKDPHPQGDKWAVNMLIITEVFSLYNLSTYLNLGLCVEDCYRELSDKGDIEYKDFLELYNRTKGLSESLGNEKLEDTLKFNDKVNSKCLEGDIKFLQKCVNKRLDIFFKKDVLDQSLSNPLMIKWLYKNGFMTFNISKPQRVEKSNQCIACIIYDYLGVYEYELYNQDTDDNINELFSEELFTEKLFSDKQTYKNICPTCPVSQYVDNVEDRLDIIEILNNIVSAGVKFEYTKNTMDYASVNERFDVLEWWKRSGYPLKFTKQIVLSVRNQKIVNWWKSFGLIEKT